MGCPNVVKKIKTNQLKNKKSYFQLFPHSQGVTTGKPLGNPAACIFSLKYTISCTTPQGFYVCFQGKRLQRVLSHIMQGSIPLRHELTIKNKRQILKNSHHILSNEFVLVSGMQPDNFILSSFTVYHKYPG